MESSTISKNVQLIELRKDMSKINNINKLTRIVQLKSLWSHASLLKIYLKSMYDITIKVFYIFAPVIATEFVKDLLCAGSMHKSPLAFDHVVLMETF